MTLIPYEKSFYVALVLNFCSCSNVSILVLQDRIQAQDMLKMFSTPVNEEFIKKEVTDTSEPQLTAPEPAMQADQVKADNKQDAEPAEQRLDASADKLADKPANSPKDKAQTKPVSKTTGTKAKTAPKAKAKTGNQAKTKTADKVKPAAKKNGKQTVKTQAKQVDKKDAKPVAKKTVKVAAKKDSKTAKADATSVSDSQKGKEEL